MTAAWRHRPDDTAPAVLATQLEDALDRLSAAAETAGAADAAPTATAADTVATRQAAVDTATAVLDLTLAYRPPTEVDRARLEVVARQPAIDTAAGDRAGQRSDAAILEVIRDRSG